MILAVPTVVLASFWSSNQQPLWQFTTFGKATSVAMSSDGSYIAVGVQTTHNPTTGKVVLLSKAGSVLWTQDSSTITSVAITADGSHVAAGGVVATTTTSGGYATLYQKGFVYYFDRDGNQLWSYSTPLHYVDYPPTPSPPWFRVILSQDGSRVIVDTGAGALVFNSLGQLLWSYTPPCQYTVCPWPTLASANASYIVNVNDQIHAFSGYGVSLWNSSIPQGQLVNGLMSPDGKYLLLEWEDTFSTSPKPTLVLLDHSGSQLWNRTLTGFAASLAMSRDGAVIVMGSGGRIISIDAQNRLVWNSTQGPANELTPTMQGTYTAALVPLDLGHNTIRILDSAGRTVWGYGDFGEVDALALSGDDSYIAVAVGPYENYSSDSGKIVFLLGPQVLVNERAATYAMFTFDPNTQNTPWLFALPPVFASIPVLYLLARSCKKTSRRVVGQNPEKAVAASTEIQGTPS